MKNLNKMNNFLAPIFHLDKKENEHSLENKSILSNVYLEDKCDILFNLNPVPTFITSLEEGKVIKINQAFLKLYGYSEEEIIGKRILDINIYENQLDREEIVKELNQNGSFKNVEIKFKNKSGQYIIGLSSGQKITIDGTDFIIGVVQDITNRKLMEAELIKRENQYRNLFDNAAEMICVIQDSKIRIFNAIFGELTGYSLEDVSSKNFLDFIYPEDREFVNLKYTDHFKTGKFNNRYQFRMIKKDKTEIWVEINSIQIEWEERQAILCFLTDIEERKNRENEVLYLSYHDQLTGLYNRRYYEKELHNLNSLEYLPLSIIMADVNGLKLTNDAFGHLTGDKLLKETADIIKEKCRDTDIAARIGGDEFIILLPNTNSADVALIEERMKLNLNNRKFGNTYLSVSFGSYTKRRNDEDINIVLTRAEDNMYRNKLLESEEMKSKTVHMIIDSFFKNNVWEDRHSKGVGELSANLAEELGLDEEDVKDIRMAGQLHDIGKAAIRKEILKKTEALTASERLEMRRHPEIGAHILKSVNQFAKIAEYVIAHHERYDGRGYPKGLKGDNIPIQARILSIANACDVMSNDCPYGKTLSKEQIIAELNAEAGKRFDPYITNVFIEKVLK